MRALVTVGVLIMVFVTSPVFAQNCLIGGCDETSEVISWQGQSWIVNGAPTPGVCPGSLVGHHHLMITEVCVGGPDEGEFIEIANTMGVDVYLRNVWLSDDCNSNDNDYINIVKNTASPPADDFIARFPTGVYLPNNTCIVIAPDGNNFFNTYGFYPDYELKSVSSAVDMETIGATATSDFLVDDDEMVVLFCWKGSPGEWGPDLVCDIDYVNWGGTGTAIDKTGICIDGPDAGLTPSCYLNDTGVVFQFIMDADNDADPMPHDPGLSAGRAECKDAAEICTGGNACQDDTVPVEQMTWGMIKAFYR
jgi:hypothetical protein